MQQAIRAVATNVGICAHQYSEITLVSTYLADRLWPWVLPVIALVILRWQRTRQERNKVRFDTDGTGPWTSTAVRSAARLVQVKMHDVKTHIAGPGDAQDSVGIRPVIVELPSRFVDELRDLHNLAVEETQCVRVGHHDGCDVRCI